MYLTPSVYIHYSSLLFCYYPLCCLHFLWHYPEVLPKTAPACCKCWCILGRSSEASGQRHSRNGISSRKTCPIPVEQLLGCTPCARGSVMHVLCQQAGGKGAQRLLRWILQHAWEGGHAVCSPATSAGGQGGFVCSFQLIQKDAPLG